MKQKDLFWGMALIGMVAFGAQSVSWAGDEVSSVTHRSFDLSGFESVRVGGVYDVDIISGREFSVSVGVENIEDFEDIKVYVDEGTLYLKNKKDWKSWKKRNRNDDIVAKITLPDLQNLDISGVANVDVRGVSAEMFDLDLSGVADVTLDGTCTDLTARVSGVGDMDAEGLKCQTASVALSGVGAVSVYTSEHIDVKTSGVGSVDVYGKPANVKQNKTFFSAVNIH